MLHYVSRWIFIRTLNSIALQDAELNYSIPNILPIYLNTRGVAKLTLVLL
jgi:hypothetical protein